MFEEGISEEAKTTLALLSGTEVLMPFYLGGGSGCSLYLSHRISVDLDFFTPKDFDPQILRIELRKMGKFHFHEASRNTLHGSLKGTKLSFFSYPYRLLFPLQKFSGIAVADLRDLACMKLDAIGSRGSKKDFTDLYFICREHSLDNIINLFKQKYAGAEYNFMHILKSLTYFEDAEKEEEALVMLKKCSWAQVKSFFIRESDRMMQIFLKDI